MIPQSNGNIVTVTVAAVLSALIAIALLSAVAGLFLLGGKPYEQLAIAERACVNHAFVSEREACAKALLGAANVSRIAAAEAGAPCPQIAPAVRSRAISSPL